ncbi:MAG: prolyl-tRNA synthetase [Candidatus Kerfeldbacteria bacterium]|nr:prolyl-tRNA synthetase [Candidatus Kerfeldbacteria bacterium]
MLQSQLFTKTRKETPADEVSKSAQLLIRAGFVHKEMAGVYSFLPLGVRVMKRIIRIIKTEMDALGGVELYLSALQDPEIWKATDRWNDASIDIWFKTKLKNDTELGLGLTHEEPLTRMLRDHISSYRDLPRYIYQFQTKFRNEVRAKSGLIRTREFLMKDLYSFNATVAELDIFYAKVGQAYERIFRAVGLGEKTFRTFAGGGAFSKFSHEYQTVCDAGEDTIYLAMDQSVAVNQEVFTDEVLNDLGKQKTDFVQARAIEVGNIFKLGTRFSEALGLMFTDGQGKTKPVVMGSYGIGPARVMATIVELYHDEKGMLWPKSVAPFDVHVVEFNPKLNSTISSAARDLIELLEKQGIAVLHDDRDLTAGQKFADSDLIGIPVRVVVSEKTVKAGKFEVKERRSEKPYGATTTEIVQTVQSTNNNT